MKSGLLLAQFSTENGFASAAIRYLTASDVSHVDLVVPRRIGLEYYDAFHAPPTTPEGLLGARLNGGVQLRPSNYAKFTRTARLGCIVPDIGAAYKFAFDQIGKPYDKGAILDFFLHRKRKFTFDAPDWFCDCLNYAIFWKGGKKLLNCDNPEGLTPAEEMLSPDLQAQFTSDALKTVQAA